MGGAKFPQKRRDGSFSVASRFSLSGDDLEHVVDAYVAEWVHRKMHDEHMDLLDDLVVPPRVVGTGERCIEIVFDGRPESRRWKDWMVLLTRDLSHAIPGVRFECFYDLIAGHPHPASARSQQPPPDSGSGRAQR